MGEPRQQRQAEAFGVALRTRRETLGLSQRDLGAAIETPHRSVHLWETGQRFPNLSTVWKIAEALATTPSELLSTTEQILAANDPDE